MISISVRMSDSFLITGLYASSLFNAFERMFDENVVIPLKGGKSAMLRTQFKSPNEENPEIIYGLIARFTRIGGTTWINKATKQDLQFELPQDISPELKETRYVFAPQAHRIAIVHSADFSITNAFDFFTDALQNVLQPDEQGFVYLETSLDAFEEIINAEVIKSLYIDISYTNADLNEESTDWMDDQLRDSSIGRIKLDIKPDATGTIDHNSLLIKGALGLAQSNGEVIASIVDENHHQKKIATINYPRREKIIDEGNEILNSSIFEKIMNISGLIQILKMEPSREEILEIHKVGFRGILRIYSPSEFLIKSPFYISFIVTAIIMVLL